MLECFYTAKLRFIQIYCFFFFSAQHLIAPSLSRTVGSGTHPRLALSRMQMLEQLVLGQGISTDKQSGLTCRALSECGCSGIHHPAEPVRKVAERVLLLVYRVNPRLVRKQLPPDDDITRRNLLYRQLFTEFDKLDRERRREMIEANKQGGNRGEKGIIFSSVPQSPPLSDSTVQYENTSKFGLNGNTINGAKNGTESPTPYSGGTPLKSKSGNAINTDKGKNSNLNLKQEKNVKQNQLKMLNQNSSKSSNSDSLEDSDSENRCSFCDWIYSGDSGELDKHYWKACPMLTKCPQCAQVLEVSALGSHLTGF